MCVAQAPGRPASEFVRSFRVALLVATVASTVAFMPVLGAVFLEHRGRWRDRAKRPRRRLWSFALALLTMPLGLAAAARTTELVLGVRVPDNADDYRFAGFLGVLIAGLFFLWQTLKDVRSAALAAELRVQRADAHRLEAQLAALTAQLDPHFLFNALNTIAALIQTDPARAESTWREARTGSRGAAPAVVASGPNFGGEPPEGFQRPEGVEGELPEGVQSPGGGQNGGFGGGEAPLHDRLLADPDSMSRYREILEAFIDGPGSPERLSTQVGVAREALGSLLTLDVDALNAKITARVDAIRTGIPTTESCE